MTSFAKINAKLRSCEIINSASLNDALKLAGLDPSKTDHSLLFRDQETGFGLSIVVAEDSLMLPCDQQIYYALGRRLFGGNAVIYQLNAHGEAVDYRVPLPPIFWFADADHVERAIAHDAVLRPILAVNGEEFWRWPNKDWRE